MRRWASVPLGLGLACAVALPPRAATGDTSDKHACFTSHEQAQLLRNGGKLHDARAQLFLCARDLCPQLLKKECSQWITEVEATQPTVVVEARDAHGDLTDVRVLVDGRSAADRLGGLSFDVDPGQHTFRFETSGGRVEERTYVIVEGEKDRRLVIEFGPTREDTPRPATAVPQAEAKTSVAIMPVQERAPAPSRRVPMLTWVFGGVAVVGLASFGAFALAGYRQEMDLRSSCAPFCSQSAIGEVHTRYVVADVSLGVGVASALVGGLVFLFRPGRAAPRAGLFVRPSLRGFAVGGTL